MTTTLSDDLAALVAAHCERTGLTREAATEELIRRGLTQLELRDVRQDVADIRATVLDIAAAQDAAGPYTVAVLSVLAHWCVTCGGVKLEELEFQGIALDTARVIWDALLAGRGVPIPSRPAAERTDPAHA